MQMRAMQHTRVRVHWPKSPTNARAQAQRPSEREDRARADRSWIRAATTGRTGALWSLLLGELCDRWQRHELIAYSNAFALIHQFAGGPTTLLGAAGGFGRNVANNQWKRTKYSRFCVDTHCPLRSEDGWVGKLFGPSVAVSIRCSMVIRVCVRLEVTEEYAQFHGKSALRRASGCAVAAGWAVGRQCVRTSGPVSNAHRIKYDGGAVVPRAITAHL